MCRWVAYRGEPIYMEDVVTKPSHSLIHQSMQASEAKTVTNGDGFGVGWYSERETPGVYRELRPAWSDENLKAICAQVRSRLFFAHVRASTGTATSRANCHPFVDGDAMFMHNGQVGCYGQLRRRIENLIPDGVYSGRAGTTDSEAIFLIARSRAETSDLVSAFESTLSDIKRMMDAHGVCEALRFTAVVTDGRSLHAFRWACDLKAPTLYWREEAGNLLIVSEPLDAVRDHWTLVPQGHVLSAPIGGRVEVRPFLQELSMAA